MNFIDQILARIFPPAKPLPAGSYAYTAPLKEGQPPLRLHLRMEANGSALLIVNASTVLHLNQTAAEYAYHLVRGVPAEEAARSTSRRYHISQKDALRDYQDFEDRLYTLVDTPDLDPVTFLDFERTEPYSAGLSAPYRLDCALTYQTTASQAGLAPVERVKRELLLDEWKTILNKAWAAGIPHVIFTGGEPTLRPDLPDLIAYAEQLGFVSGMLSDGLRLAEKDYLQQVLQSGLDHLMITFDPAQDQSWEALRDVLASDLYTTVHLTYPLPAGQTDLLPRLKEMGVQSLSLSASGPEHKDDLQAARNQAAQLEIPLVWDLPVPYSEFHPVALELEEAGETVDGAGLAWLYVEPDGDVLPAQGVNRVLGSLLTDPWEKVWAAARAE